MEPVLRIPDENESKFCTVTSMSRLTSPEKLEIVRLLKVVDTVPPTVCAESPLNSTVVLLPVRLVMLELFVQFPPTLMVVLGSLSNLGFAASSIITLKN